MGTLSLGELEHTEEVEAERRDESKQEISEMKLAHETQVLQLQQR